VSLERVGGANRRVTGHEEPDPHEGLTGFQSRSGSGSLDERSKATAAAMATATRTRGEYRFTGEECMPDLIVICEGRASRGEFG
jgi:hypothetical protein